MNISKCSHRLCYIVDCEDHSHVFSDALVHAYLYRGYEPLEAEAPILRELAGAIYTNAGNANGIPFHDCTERGCFPQPRELN